MFVEVRYWGMRMKWVEHVFRELFVVGGGGKLGREGAFGTSDIGYEITFTIFA